MNDLQNIFQSLRIPSEYEQFQSLADDSDALRALDPWRQNVQHAVAALGDLVRDPAERLDDDMLADIVFYLSPFSIAPEHDGLDLSPWTDQSMRNIAFDILSTPQISQPTPALIRHVLVNNLKPIFASNPHPYINTTTGRKLHRPAGGPGATHDYYDEQTWKTYPGIWSVLAWVVKNMQPNSYEDLWPLLVPPMMTLLDDFRAQHKLEGVQIVSLMLHTIPKEILRRTGVDQLIFTSFKTCLSHLSDPETPTLLRLTISTWLNLTLKVDEPGTFEFFDHLCTLVSNNIIESVWLSCQDNIGVMKASLDALPDVFRALDTATISFLKSVIPQLAHIMLMQIQSSPQKQTTKDIIELQKSAGKALLVIIEVGSSRMEGWKFTILDCVAQCWVRGIDAGTGGMDSGLQAILREIMLRLATACPDISQDAYKALLTEDHSMFNGLVGS
ncbi:hypothetical protein AGABI1DRAFT_131988 [Agaricus bisporus var. burnettii JB137-S8]|uniref:Uncharacterized protein n=1 Tax=Agaricus bisporus var. burnettii (strain JB137-S8 / ATCC MYA-4627 / FGSC 10392) TaxID=597362 RepID=K5VMT9_AGABU|nr:uncharacterized protein AGABI1DRAFT_131988 [Agaricus bisporus var. burnettii JB137-S8]EKM75759.1 hypothetical protein AGABI1DRAFT_131988 [Agaricus bisporus var. burnettii JB137-S8]